MKWYVYILKCKNEKLYTGITIDINRRFREHQNKSAKFTAYNPPEKVVYRELCLSRSEACRRELAIKQMTKVKKLKLINGN